MKTIYLESFEKDIKKIKEKDVKKTLLNLPRRYLMIPPHGPAVFFKNFG